MVFAFLPHGLLPMRTTLIDNHMSSLVIKRIIISIICLFLLSSCSTRLTYNFLDWWLAWTINDYIDLNHQQSTVIKQHINHFHRWHRRHELPRYVNFLTKAQHRLNQGPIDATELSQLSDEAVNLLQASINQLVIPAKELLTTLTPDQTTSLFENLKEKNQEFKVKYADLSTKESKRRRVKRMRQFLKPWVGRLNKQQHSFIEQWAERFLPSWQLILQERHLWQTQLAYTLTLPHDTKEFHEETTQLLIYPEDRWSSDYRQCLAYNQQLTMELFAAINNSLTKKQIKRRNRHFQDYIQDLTHLSDKTKEASD